MNTRTDAEDRIDLVKDLETVGINLATLKEQSAFIPLSDLIQGNWLTVLALTNRMMKDIQIKLQNNRHWMKEMRPTLRLENVIAHLQRCLDEWKSEENKTPNMEFKREITRLRLNLAGFKVQFEQDPEDMEILQLFNNDWTIFECLLPVLREMTRLDTFDDSAYNLGKAMLHSITNCTRLTWRLKNPHHVSLYVDMFAHWNLQIREWEKIAEEKGLERVSQVLAQAANDGEKLVDYYKRNP